MGNFKKGTSALLAGQEVTGIRSPCLHYANCRADATDGATLSYHETGNPLL
jgi:hypothetical protein